MLGCRVVVVLGVVVELDVVVVGGVVVVLVVVVLGVVVVLAWWSSWLDVVRQSAGELRRPCSRPGRGWVSVVLLMERAG